MALQPAFGFQANELYKSLANMIIAQEVYGDSIKDMNDDLVSKFKREGSLYGDSLYFYATNALESHEFLNDLEAQNLLDVDRAKDPEVQKVVLDQFRQIRLSTDQYLSKRAWSNQGAFTQFNSILLSWISNTKRIYDATLINAYVGTNETSIGKQEQTVDFTALTSSASTQEEANRLCGQAVAKKIADILVDIKDPIISKKYNDYGFYRTYDAGDFIAVFNADEYNKVLKIDLPTVFNTEGLKLDNFDKVVLPADYFGVTITSTNVATYSDATPAPGKPIDSDDKTYTPGVNNANGKICTNAEISIKVGGTVYHLFPGEELPAGTVIDSTADLANGQVAYGTVYIVDKTILFKLVHKRSVVFMSAFQTNTEFVNPRALLQTNYLTWGYSKPTKLLNYPYVTVRKV